jgi:hypothetical protein
MRCGPTKALCRLLGSLDHGQDGRPQNAYTNELMHITSLFSFLQLGPIADFDSGCVFSHGSGLAILV